MAPIQPAKRMSLDFTTLDVFTSIPYEGNPLAVVRVPANLSDALTQTQKQRIAYEFNLSETIFLHEQSPGVTEWAVDIFTNTAELPFAGHPTIGSAFYVLDLSSEPSPKSGTILTKAGRIPISSMENGGVAAKIPHNVRIHKHTLADLMDPSVGLSPFAIIFEEEKTAPLVSIVKGMTFHLVQLPSLDVLGQVVSEPRQIDFCQMLDKGWEEGFVATYYFVVGPAGGDGRVEVRTRMIEATMEDPATGSAACALGSYLALTGVGLDGGGRVGRYQMVQGVEMGRKSVIGVSVELNESGHGERRVETIILSGSAVKVMEGKLFI